MKKLRKTVIAVLVAILFIGVISGQSMVVSAETTTVSAPTIEVKNSTTGTALKVTWNKVSKADGYVVYMATSKTGKYTKVTTTKTSYTTKNLTKNKTYYFKVKAYDTVNGEKVYSKNSIAVKCKTSKYSLYKVIDKGGDNVYFYFLYDGTAWKGDDYWTCFNTIIAMLNERHGGNDVSGMNADAKSTGYYINGKEVMKAIPHSW